MASKELLITGSVGLRLVNGKYYLEVITATEYNFYFAPITRDQAIVLSKADNISMPRPEPTFPEGSFVMGV